MIKLVVDDTSQITFLEAALMLANIEYETAIYEDVYDIELPYIIVYGVPLDENRAIEWIKEQSDNE